MHGGYCSAPHTKLLTDEARAFLEATLGLATGAKAMTAMDGSQVEQTSSPPTI